MGRTDAQCQLTLESNIELYIHPILSVIFMSRSEHARRITQHGNAPRFVERDPKRERELSPKVKNLS